jgi:hypothetical protein
MSFDAPNPNNPERTIPHATVIPVDGATGLYFTHPDATRLRVEPLGQPSIPHQIEATTTSANQALTATCRRASITAEGCKMRYLVGDEEQTASATTSHMIRDGERLDIAVPANGHIAVIRDSAATSNGVLEISELA